MTQTQQDTPEPSRSHCIVAGEVRNGTERRNVTSPYSGEVVSTVSDATVELVADAIAVGRTGAGEMAAMPPHERRAKLLLAAGLLDERAPDIARMLCLETGKAIRDCNTELSRASDVIVLSAEESVRIAGRHIPLEASKTGHGKLAFSARFPVGLVAGIVPFNAPVNLTCHKVAPALAAGNAIVLKAPPQAPMTIELVVRAFLDAGFPSASIGLLHGGAEVGASLVHNPLVNFLSFTGSHTAGLAIKQAAGTRGCVLELGGVGPTIVHRDADIGRAADIIAVAGFRLAGQSCASVQNLFVHTDVVDRFTDAFLARIATLKTGDPLDPATDLGPVIDGRAADRIMQALDAAVAGGAKCLTGGTREGLTIAPTVLTNVSPRMGVVCQEIFGPVVVLRPYDDLAEPIEWIAGTDMGINCGLFTDSNSVIQQAFQSIPSAAIIVNGTSTFRPDQLPYGGVGRSGYGRESPAETILAMTQERILVLS
jgi:acyl-CoA reductase-like NAD-dependent aldehyde dehydrogenase